MANGVAGEISRNLGVVHRQHVGVAEALSLPCGELLLHIVEVSLDAGLVSGERSGLVALAEEHLGLDEASLVVGHDLEVADGASLERARGTHGSGVERVVSGEVPIHVVLLLRLVARELGVATQRDVCRVAGVGVVGAVDVDRTCLVSHLHLCAVNCCLVELLNVGNKLVACGGVGNVIGYVLVCGCPCRGHDAVPSHGLQALAVAVAVNAFGACPVVRLHLAVHDLDVRHHCRHDLRVAWILNARAAHVGEQVGIVFRYALSSAVSHAVPVAIGHDGVAHEIVGNVLSAVVAWHHGVVVYALWAL